MAAVATRLLEREHLLEALHAALAQAEAGDGRLVLVGGEAGVGKTALVRSFCAEQHGVAVWAGACDALFTPRPLGPFLDIAEDVHEIAAATRANDVVSTLLHAARERGRAILVLEDVHWADEATLDGLRLLARKVEAAPLLVIATYRDDELARVHPLRIVLGEIATRPAVERLSVPPLSPDAVAELAHEAGIDAGELYRQTSGNSFYVTEALAAGGGSIPSTVRDAVLARAARLSPPARAALDAVAIASPRVELWLLEAAGADDGLAEAIASGMLSALATTIEFRHELARLAIEDSVGPARRLDLHRRVLTALADPPTGEPDVVRLAHHAEAAGDTEAVLRYAPAAAARAAAVGAYREAAGQLARALRFEELLTPERRAELLGLYSDACYSTDRCLDAIAAVERMLETYRAVGDRHKEGEALCLLSRLQMCPASVLEAEPAGRRAVEILEEFPPDAALAIAYANLTAIAMNAEDAESTRAWGARAIELAEHVGDSEALVHALCSAGTMEMLLRGPRAGTQAERSLQLARAAGLEVHVLRAHSNMAWAAWRHRAYALADEWLGAGLAICEEPDYDLWRSQMLAHQACVRLDQGRWDEAVNAARRAINDPLSSPLPRILGRVVLGLVRARRGDPHVRPLLAEAAALAAGSGELQRIGPAAAALAEAAWLTGDVASIDGMTADALRLAVDRRAGWIVGQLVSWRRRAGIDEPVPAVPEPFALELAGRPEDAAEAWIALGCPYEAALALADAQDERTLRLAHDRLQELGARPAAAAVARKLRGLGVRGLPRGPRQRTRANAAQLTERELEVLELLASGRRNAAIAERLFVSPRTVDHHVSAILRKLDVDTRGEAVAEAARLNLLR
jgi:DNA-binding CsgD family transcriptional regulator/tetratricopeptide (TPR) repeat protein